MNVLSSGRVLTRSPGSMVGRAFGVTQGAGDKSFGCGDIRRDDFGMTSRAESVGKISPGRTGRRAGPFHAAVRRGPWGSSTAGELRMDSRYPPSEAQAPRE